MQIAITKTVTRMVDVNDTTFNERVKYIRVEAGLKQSDLALTLGLSRSQIANLEIGSTKGMSIDNLNVFSREFNVNLNWLVSGEGRPHKRKSK